jgi:hypothetical protein
MKRPAVAGGAQVGTVEVDHHDLNTRQPTFPQGLPDLARAIEAEHQAARQAARTALA